MEDKEVASKKTEELYKKLTGIIETIVRTTALKAGEENFDVFFNRNGDFSSNPTGWSLEAQVVKGKKALLVNFPFDISLDLSYAGFLDALLTTVATRKYEAVKRTDMAFIANFAVSRHEEAYVKTLAFSLNVMGDLYSKNKIVKDYPGTMDYFMESSKTFDKAATEKVMEQIGDVEKYLMNIERMVWNQEPVGVNEKVEGALIETLSQIDELFNKKVKNFTQTFLNSVWPHIKELIPEENGEPQEMPEYSSLSDMKEKTVLDKAKEMKGQPSEDKEGKGNSENQTEGEDSKDKGEDAEGENAIKSLKEALEEMVTKDKTGMTPEEFKKMEAERNSAKVKIEEADGSKANVYENSPKPYWELLQEVSSYAYVFRHKLENILKDNKIARMGGNFRSGTLTKTKLYKLKLNSDKLFTRKIQRRFKSYAVTLLADSSGSMSGDPMRQVGLSCVLMSEVLNKIGVDFEIIAFDDRLRYLKRFGQKFDWTVKKNLEILHNNGLSGGSTYMASALNEATHRIRLQQVDKRMLILLTDGEPNAYGPLPDYMVKRLARQGRKERYQQDFDLGTEIETAQKHLALIGVGIGMQTDFLKEYIDDVEIMQDVSKLPEMIIKKIKQYIKRG